MPRTPSTTAISKRRAEPVMLQPVVGDHGVQTVLGEKTLRGGDAVGPRDHGAAGAAREQHRLVADLVVNGGDWGSERLFARRRS